MRINQYLAQHLEECSRRYADRLISSGRVRVNGETAKLGRLVNPAQDKIVVDGRIVAKQSPPSITIAFYKPAGVITTRKDPSDRPIVMDFLPKKYAHLKPVGRLDSESEGLLLLTNDGGLANRMTHPKYEKKKVYRLHLAQPVTGRLILRFQKGISLKEGTAKADFIKKIGKSDIEVAIHQGWSRQLRRMSAACDNAVVRLLRVQFGPVALGELKPGEWREINI